jgi:protein-disulfide isomerase
MEKFERDRAKPELTNLINRDLQQGQVAGVRGTPSIFVNGKLLSNRSLEGFSQAIDREIKQK